MKNLKIGRLYKFIPLERLVPDLTNHEITNSKANSNNNVTHFFLQKFTPQTWRVPVEEISSEEDRKKPFYHAFFFSDEELTYNVTHASYKYIPVRTENMPVEQPFLLTEIEYNETYRSINMNRYEKYLASKHGVKRAKSLVRDMKNEVSYITILLNEQMFRVRYEARAWDLIPAEKNVNKHLIALKLSLMFDK